MTFFVSSLIDGIRASEIENLHENFIVVINFECRKKENKWGVNMRDEGGLSEKKIK